MNDPDTEKCCWQDIEGYAHHFRDYVDKKEDELAKDIARRYIKYNKETGIIGIGDAVYHRHDTGDNYDVYKRTVTTSW